MVQRKSEKNSSVRFFGPESVAFLSSANQSTDQECTSPTLLKVGMPSSRRTSHTIQVLLALIVVSQSSHGNKERKTIIPLLSKMFSLAVSSPSTSRKPTSLDETPQFCSHAAYYSEWSWEPQEWSLSPCCSGIPSVPSLSQIKFSGNL